MIKFEQVTFAYRKEEPQPVLDSFSLSIEQGQEVAVIGGNGSGKTTLGLLLCGILKPDLGHVEVDGVSPGYNSHQPVIGFLFQDPDNGLVATTVEREVAFSLENMNIPTEPMREKVERTLDLFNMKPLRERLVWNLSGGEKQRLSLAGLFVAEPNILFLDEPASFLDYAGTLKLEKTLSRIKEIDPSITIIRVTQFPRVAEKYERVVLIGRGRVLKDGSPDDIFSDRAMLSQAGLRPPLRFLSPIANGHTEGGSRASSAGSDRLLTMNNVIFKYPFSDTPYVLDGVSVTVFHAEVLALVGSSGSGKSTLAQMICGLYEPTDGEMKFVSPEVRAVMSFQQPERQFFCDTAFEEVAYGIKKNHGTLELLRGAVRESMELCDLDFELFEHRDPHTLSGGEARRLAFAVVVALGAEIIIFDEPACALDEAGIKAFKLLVRSLKQAGKAVIIISHNSDIVADLADRVAHMEKGRMISVSDTLDFFRSNRYSEVLADPEVIAYQQSAWGEVSTTRAEDIFGLDDFSA